MITTDANGAASVYAADVDGDGDLDVLSASRTDDKVAWYENDGAGNFVIHAVSPDDVGTGEIVTADMDSDGDLDVISASDRGSPIHDGRVAWYENDGSRNFVTHVIITSAFGASSVYATDVDGDGDTDALSALPGEWPDYDDEIVWHENDGAQNFTTHVISTDTQAVGSVYAIDVDGDGDVDVLSASAVDDKIAWYENDGVQNFTTHVIATDVAWALSVYAIDVDGDGDTDVLSASFADDEIAWYENDGAENFIAHVIAANADEASSVYATDVDGDGDVDVLSALRTGGEIAWHENDGAQNFSRHVIADSTWYTSVYAADVDGDGDTDVLGTGLFDDEFAWYENDGAQNFATRVLAVNAGRTLSSYASDLDGDGDMDVLSAGRDGILLYENKLGVGGLTALRSCSHTSVPGCICGNALVEGDEACDDGNLIDGDSCSSTCEQEAAQDRAQRDCITTLNFSGSRVALKQGGHGTKCLRSAAKQKVGDAKACLTARTRRSLLRVMQTTADRDTGECLPNLPDFGYAGATAVNSASLGQEVALALDIFGDDFNSAVIDSGLDRSGSSCQIRVSKSYEKLVRANLRAFLNCKDAGMRTGTIVSGSGLATECLAALSADKRVVSAVGKLANEVARRCSGTDVNVAFPGLCVSSADFTTCVEQRVECRVCLMLSRTDAFAADCESFDDGLVNASCTSQ